METVTNVLGWNDDEPTSVLVHERGIYELSYEEAELWRLRIEKKLTERRAVVAPDTPFFEELLELFTPGPRLS